MAHPSHLYAPLQMRIQEPVLFTSVLSLHKCMEDTYFL
jgi:hypothetical protein